eukprot:1139105-Pelagomonas_calceolata.AAC.5
MPDGPHSNSLTMRGCGTPAATHAASREEEQGRRSHEMTHDALLTNTRGSLMHPWRSCSNTPLAWLSCAPLA